MHHRRQRRALPAGRLGLHLFRRRRAQPGRHQLCRHDVRLALARHAERRLRQRHPAWRHTATTGCSAATATTICTAAPADVMTGGTGYDAFIFDAITDSVPGAYRDRITDFQEDIDYIDLSKIDANVFAAGNQAFRFIGAHAFTAAAQLAYTFVGRRHDHLGQHRQRCGGRIPGRAQRPPLHDRQRLHPVRLAGSDNGRPAKPGGRFLSPCEALQQGPIRNHAIACTFRFALVRECPDLGPRRAQTGAYSLLQNCWSPPPPPPPPALALLDDATSPPSARRVDEGAMVAAAPLAQTGSMIPRARPFRSPRRSQPSPLPTLSIRRRK